MKQPNGADLMRTLVKLYTDQMGVKITCKIEERKEEHERSV